MSNVIDFPTARADQRWHLSLHLDAGVAVHLPDVRTVEDARVVLDDAPLLAAVAARVAPDVIENAAEVAADDAEGAQMLIMAALGYAAATDEERAAVERLR